MTEITINNDMTMGGATGTLLAGRYRVVRQLGQGGMGSVWLAEDTKLDRFKVAVKMLPSVLVNNKRAYAQVKAEALVSLKLSHPNIVTVRAFEEDGGSPFLVMDYIDGQTLDDYLAEKGKLTEEETVKLLKPVAAALDYAHSQGVVHRDVKPGNVMIRKDGTPFVLDFGIAREIQETMTRVTGKLSSGTLLYMSPEQLCGQKPTVFQDVYSLAAMAYECLKGEPPFCRGQIEYQILHSEPEPFQDGGALGNSILCGLSKEPLDRPQTSLKLFELSASNKDLLSVDSRDVSRNGLSRPMTAETVAAHEQKTQEAHDPVEFDLLMAKAKVRRRNIESAYEEVVEFCKNNPGFSRCQEEAWELLSEAMVDSHPETSCAAKKHLDRLEDIERKISKSVSTEKENREEMGLSREMEFELTSVLVPEADKYKASKYAAGLYAEGLGFAEKGRKAVAENKYAAAVHLFGLAKDCLTRAARESRRDYLKVILSVVKEYEAAGMKEDCQRMVREGLEVDPDNQSLKDALDRLANGEQKEIVVCSTIDGREVLGAQIEVEDKPLLSTPIRASDCNELLAFPRYLKYNEDGQKYIGLLDARKIDFASGKMFVMVPLRRYPNFSEMLSLCRISPRCCLWLPIFLAAVLSLFIGLLVGSFAAGISESANKFPAGIFFGLLAFLSIFFMLFRNFLSNEVEKVMFDNLEYEQKNSRDDPRRPLFSLLESVEHE